LALNDIVRSAELAMVAFPYFRRAVAATREAAAGAAVRPRRGKSIGRMFSAANIWFWAIVGVPTLIAAVYYFGIASNLYMSEADFVLRGPGTVKSMGGLASMLQSSSGGEQPGRDEALIVQRFIMSRDVVRLLAQHDDLYRVLDRPEGDVVSRFPGMLFWRNDFEALYKAYSRFVEVDIDGETGVSVLKVKAYRPEDAQRIAQALVGYSEQLVNELNDRTRQEALRSFQNEVERTQQRIAGIQAQLTAYRIKQQMLDPKTAAEGPLALLKVLNEHRATAEAQLADTIKNSPSSPQVMLLRTRVVSLDRLIADERTKITGDGNSVAVAQTEYERLDEARKLAETELASAYKSLEAARLDAQRQELFLATVAQPNLPDFPLYPKRVVSFSMVLATCLLAYGIAWLLVASVREHAAA
jgi:capsular polysaccharide transport system permease protein